MKAIQDALVDEKLVAFAVMPSPGKGVIRLRAAVDTSKGRGESKVR